MKERTILSTNELHRESFDMLQPRLKVNNNIYITMSWSTLVWSFNFLFFYALLETSVVSSILNEADSMQSFTQKKKKKTMRLKIMSHICTWSLDSRKARMVPGMMPLTPPPSMLNTVTMLPSEGGVRGDEREPFLAIGMWSTNLREVAMKP